MNKRLTMTLLLAAAVALAAPATAQQLFDFNGQAVVPAAVGGDLALDAIVYDAAPATTPIPLNFADYQYTLVITGLELITDGPTQVYAGGAIALYEDAATAADFTNGATFSDGTAILTGVVTDLNRTMYTATLGSVLGHVDWTGGTRLSDIAPADQAGWPILSGINASASQTEPGYSENWDGKVEPTEEIVGNEVIPMGDLKVLFR
ncbi:MAG TPA: hypothetical protein P5571_12370 [Candidatus Krumholzibacteria bacterium]|nr:hypothetical protein [Candidatus Krumholzibacteria bacterium]HRX52155.1 hypothetical protein [Candidatus Krumholzibacteria bacterium]